MPSARENHRWHGRNSFLQVGEAFNRVLPDLVSIRRQIHFGLGVAIENASLLVIQVEQFLALLLVLEERLVCAYDFCILPETLADSGAQPDHSLNTVGRKERV